MAQTKRFFENVTFFEVRGSKQTIQFNKDVLLRICELMARENPTTFFQIARRLGRDRVWVDRDKSNFFKAKKILGTELFIDTNLNTKTIVKMAHELFESFGNRSSDLRIVTEIEER